MEQSKNIRAKKMMLWFSMISISMTFAGLTSAYVVSKSRPDWLEDFSLPMSLYWSTLVILLSSVTFWQANKKLTAQPKATASFIMGDPRLLRWRLYSYNSRAFRVWSIWDTISLVRKAMSRLRFCMFWCWFTSRIWSQDSSFY
jgi:hypothetical protein